MDAPLRTLLRPEIPKTIHLIWVGGKAPPPLVARCVETWRSQMPDFEIMQWNEFNSPMHHPFVERMYAAGKWAFVSDYLRFWVLNQHGGVYLDTDMEVIRSFGPCVQRGPFLAETKDGGAAAGILAFPAGHGLMRDALAFYDRPVMSVEAITSPNVLRALIRDHAYDMTIYSHELFYPCDEGEKMGQDQLRIAYTNHLWAESWVPHAWARKILRRLRVAKLAKRILSRCNRLLAVQ